MVLKAVYPDGSWLAGKLHATWRYRETPGTHHLQVTAASHNLTGLIGQKVAVVIAQVQYFILEYKVGKVT